MRHTSETIHRYWLDEDERITLNDMTQPRVARKVTLHVNYIEVADFGEYSIVHFKGHDTEGVFAVVRILPHRDPDRWKAVLAQLPAFWALKFEHEVVKS